MEGSDSRVVRHTRAILVGLIAGSVVFLVLGGVLVGVCGGGISLILFGIAVGLAGGAVVIMGGAVLWLPVAIIAILLFIVGASAASGAGCSF